MYKILLGICLLSGMCAWADEMAGSDVRDPTAPLGHMKNHNVSGNSQFDLSSVLISPTRKVAIINGSALREGQIVPGSSNVRVQRISRQTVVLQQADQTWELRLSPSVVKKH